MVSIKVLTDKIKHSTKPNDYLSNPMQSLPVCNVLFSVSVFVTGPLDVSKLLRACCIYSCRLERSRIRMAC